MSSRWMMVVAVVMLVLVSAMALRNAVVSVSASNPAPPTPWISASNPAPPTPWLSNPAPPTPWGR